MLASILEFIEINFIPKAKTREMDNENGMKLDFGRYEVTKIVVSWGQDVGKGEGEMEENLMQLDDRTVG